MGVKSVRTVTIFSCSPRYYLLLLHNISMFTAIFIFVASRYFRVHRDAIFLLHHDISDFTAMSSFVALRYFRFHPDAIFCYFTIFLNSPRSHRLLNHDISEFTAMPSFDAPRYFLICTNSFRSPNLTPASAARHHSTSLEIMPALSRRLQAAVRI